MEYDDGEAEWLALSQEQFKVVAAGKKGLKKPAGRRAAVLLSDDDEPASEEAEEEADDSGSEYGEWLRAVTPACAHASAPVQQQ